MMKNKFANYIAYREQSEDKPNNNVLSKIKLKKNDGSNDFLPFSVSKSSRPNLRILLKAFDISDQVSLGYTTIEKNKGEVEPTLKKKVIYLTGGAVRDHLKNKTPKNYNLVTNATASEIKLILKHPDNRFIEIAPQKPEKASLEKYNRLPEASEKNKMFYASRWDKGGKEIEFTIVINDEKFNLATMSKASKSGMVEPESADITDSIEDDAHNRDFTINSLYLPLNNSDGDNTDLIDMYGGAHHLKNNQIVSVNDDFESRVNEDPNTALRYIRMISKFGDSDSPSKKHISIIKKNDKLFDLPKDVLKKEFLSNLEDPDIDTRKYLKLLDGLGILHHIHPASNLDDMPPNLVGDRWLTPAWLAKDEDAEGLKGMLVDHGWSKQEASDISHLVKMHQWAKNKYDPNMFYDLKSHKHGMTSSKVKEWMKMSNFKDPQVAAFFMHDDSDLKPYVDTSMGKKINPEYINSLGRTPQGDDFEKTKRHLSTKRFMDSY